jgi:hypothetical protein
MTADFSDWWREPLACCLTPFSLAARISAGKLPRAIASFPEARYLSASLTRLTTLFLKVDQLQTDHKPQVFGLSRFVPVDEKRSIPDTTGPN